MPQYIINILLMAAFLIIATVTFKGYADDNMVACQDGIVVVNMIEDGYDVTIPETINGEVLTCELD